MAASLNVCSRWPQRPMMSGILRREQLAMLMACFGHVITVVAQDVFVMFHYKTQKAPRLSKVIFSSAILGSMATAFGPLSCRKN